MPALKPTLEGRAFARALWRLVRIYWTSSDAKWGALLLATAVVLQLSCVYVNVLVSFGQRDVGNSLGARDVEWDYGRYEGRTSAEIHAERPDWLLFRDGCPGGESPAQVGARADRVVSASARSGVLLFSSGHFLRTLAARWLGLEPAAESYFLLGTASLSALAYDHGASEPAIRLWNDTRHVEA